MKYQYYYPFYQKKSVTFSTRDFKKAFTKDEINSFIENLGEDIVEDYNKGWGKFSGARILQNALTMRNYRGKLNYNDIVNELEILKYHHQYGKYDELQGEQYYRIKL